MAVFGAFMGLLLRKFNFDGYGQIGLIGLIVLIGLAAETSLARLRRDRLVAFVDLYRALGGGWQEGTDAQR